MMIGVYIQGKKTVLGISDLSWKSGIRMLTIEPFLFSGLKSSNNILILIGVMFVLPQGSCAELLLFFIYLND